MLRVASRFAPLLAIAGLAACGTSRLDLGDPPPPPDAGCIPGTYAGSYQCMAGGPIQITGSIALPMMNDGTGSLVVAKGTQLTSSDGQGGSVTADVSGKLDCASRKLTGDLSGVQYTNASVTASFAGSGTLSGDYDAGSASDGAAATPALVDGVITWPPSPGLSGSPTSCTWSATLR